jgi:hypothetical protein
MQGYRDPDRAPAPCGVELPACQAGVMDAARAAAHLVQRSLIRAIQAYPADVALLAVRGGGRHTGLLLAHVDWIAAKHAYTATNAFYRCVYVPGIMHTSNTPCNARLGMSNGPSHFARCGCDTTPWCVPYVSRCSAHCIPELSHRPCGTSRCVRAPRCGQPVRLRAAYAFRYGRQVQSRNTSTRRMS